MTLRAPTWFGAAAVVLGCARETPRPWDQPDAAAALPPPLPIAATSLLPEPSASASARAAAGDPDLPHLPVRVGGPWVRCYGHFKPSGDPLKDVTRLGLICGPPNGMHRVASSQGDVDARGGAVEEKVEARRGACYRVFAVGDAAVAELHVTMRTSRGSAIADERGPDAWPILQPDRPLCALEDDRWVLEVRAQRGRGHFAAEVWALSTEP